MKRQDGTEIIPIVAPITGGKLNFGEYSKQAGTRFGQGKNDEFRGGKTCRQWIAQLCKMDETQIKDFIKNTKNPAMIRKFAKLLMQADTVETLIKTVDSIESKPAEKIEMSPEDLTVKIEMV